VFHLSLVDHIRLSLASAIAGYEGHADAAARLARHAWYARVGTITMVAATAILSGVALQQGRGFQIAATTAATMALAACAAYLAFDPTARIFGHRASAARLWQLCEGYRMLLAEVRDELLDVDAIKERRTALAHEAASILEQAPPNDRYSYEIARAALRGAGGRGYSDADLDRYLPPSLRVPAPAPAEALEAPHSSSPAA
jgi:hypothetical protein